MDENRAAQQGDDAARGIDLAARCLAELGDGNDEAALVLLNGADTAEVRWCAAYLLSVVREAVGERVARNPHKLRRALSVAREAAEEDSLVTRVQLMTAAAAVAEGEGGGDRG